MVVFHVPYDYAESTGLLNSDFHLPSSIGSPKSESMLAEFVEHDEFGGVWLRAVIGKKAGKGILMIPRDAILSMFINPTKEIEKQFGFKLPDNIKKRLDK